MLLILVVFASFRYGQHLKRGVHVEGGKVAAEYELSIKNYPEFSKNIQYFETESGRVVTDRYPKFQKGDVVSISGRFDEQKDAFWFPELVLVSKSGGYQAWMNNFREWTLGRINHNLKHRQAELVSGMLIGHNDLSERLSQSLKSSGIIHIVVVSGQNLTMIFAFLAVAGSRFLKRKIFLVTAGVILLAYLGLVGFAPPVVRAYLMILIAIMAEMSGRKYSGLYALLISGSVMVAIDPVVIHSVSFQLSFLASIGIVFGLNIVRGLNLRQNGFRKSLIEVYVTSFFAWVFTTPVTITSFDSISIVAPIVNLMMLWLIPVVMVWGAVVLVPFLPRFATDYFSASLDLVLSVLISFIELFAKINDYLLQANRITSLGIVIVSYILILILIKKFILKK